MPLSLRRGRVTAVTERVAGLARIEVDGRPCIAYPRLTGPVALGDDVLVNTQALDLGLGSGGFDVLHANLTRGLDLPATPGAHLMKLPYTSLQHATAHGEEEGDFEPRSSLQGTPVVCCTLHSQLAPVCAGLGRGIRVAYVQIAGGALPVSLSDTVRTLKASGLLEVAIAAGPCLDGDVACVNVASALDWCARHSFDGVVCSVGPGIVGTGTPLGHGALSAAEAANAAIALGGRAILAPRVSTVDARRRHHGVSHHVHSVLELALGPVAVALPEGLDLAEEITGSRIVDVTGWEEACAGLPLSTMGRGPGDDPWFFAAAFGAGRLAREYLE